MYQAFNINKYIKFRLTKTGKKILEKHYKDLDKFLNRKCTRYKTNSEGVYKMQMWIAMEIFYSGFSLGATESPFKNSEIFFEVNE